MRSMLVWGRRIAMAALLALAVSPLHIPVPGVTAAATALAIIFLGLYWTQSDEVTAHSGSRIDLLKIGASAE